MFKLNEAPNIALSIISAEKTSRNCSLFWSIICCPPTLGLSLIGYPDSINSQAKASRTSLIDALTGIRDLTKNNADNPDVKLDMQTNKSQEKIIAWQVKSTIDVLSLEIKFLNNNASSYREALEHALEIIKTRAERAQALGECLSIEKLGITGAELHVPTYFDHSPN